MHSRLFNLWLLKELGVEHSLEEARGCVFPAFLSPAREERWGCMIGDRFRVAEEAWGRELEGLYCIAVWAAWVMRSGLIQAWLLGKLGIARSKTSIEGFLAGHTWRCTFKGLPDLAAEGLWVLA